jgi:hypothetical protein
MVTAKKQPSKRELLMIIRLDPIGAPHWLSKRMPPRIIARKTS